MVKNIYKFKTEDNFGTKHIKINNKKQTIEFYYEKDKKNIYKRDYKKQNYSKNEFERDKKSLIDIFSN